MDWIDVNERLPSGSGGVCMVKRSNWLAVKAYYHRDKMKGLMAFRDVKTSHFQDHKTREFLFDVTHWGPIPKEPDAVD